MKRVRFFTLTMLAACLLAFSPQAIMAAETVKVAFIGDFTGPSFQMTKDSEQAAAIAVEEINASGGLLGCQIEMIKRDGVKRPELHARLAHEVVEQEKVKAIFGGASSNCVLGASAVAKELKIPYLVSVGNAPHIVWHKGHRYVFLFEPNLAMEINGFAAWAAKKPWKNYAWIGPDYGGSRYVLKAFKDRMAAMGKKITFKKELWYKLGETNFASYIPVLKASKAEVLFCLPFGPALIIQARDAGFFERMAVFGFISEDICFALEDKIPPGIYGFSRGPFNYFAAKYPAGKAFVDKYHKKYNRYPGGFSFCGYDSVIAWAAAVKKAGSFDIEKTVDALKGLKFSGPRGDQHVRTFDGQLSAVVSVGPLKYNKKYGFAVIDPVTPIPAEEVWLSEKEIKALRAK